jgi:hypothetical protein
MEVAEHHRIFRVLLFVLVVPAIPTIEWRSSRTSKSFRSYWRTLKSSLVSYFKVSIRKHPNACNAQCILGFTLPEVHIADQGCAIAVDSPHASKFTIPRDPKVRRVTDWIALTLLESCLKRSLAALIQTDAALQYPPASTDPGTDLDRRNNI